VLTEKTDAVFVSPVPADTTPALTTKESTYPLVTAWFAAVAVPTVTAPAKVPAAVTFKEVTVTAPADNEPANVPDETTETLVTDKVPVVLFQLKPSECASAADPLPYNTFPVVKVTLPVPPDETDSAVCNDRFPETA